MSTRKRRDIERRLWSVIARLGDIAQALQQLGEEGLRGMLGEAIAQTMLTSDALHDRIAETRDKRGPKSPEPPTLRAAT